MPPALKSWSSEWGPVVRVEDQRGEVEAPYFLVERTADHHELGDARQQIFGLK